MKTNTLKVVFGTLAIGAVPVVLMRNMPAGILFPAVAVAVSYVAVAILVALTAVDYRVGPRNYAAR